MADYYPLLAKAVSALPSSDREQRTAIYERARKALVGQLKSITPPVEDSDIERESVALDAAIARLEEELAQAQSASPAPSASAITRKSLPPLPPLPPKLDLAQLAKSTRANSTNANSTNAKPISKPIPQSIDQPEDKVKDKPEDKADVATEIKPNAPSLEPLSFAVQGQDRPVLPPNPPSSKAPSVNSPSITSPSITSPSFEVLGSNLPDPKGQGEAPILVADKEPVFAPITTQDLSLAQPPLRPRLTPLRFLLGLSVLICVSVTAILAFYWRDIPQGTVRSLPAQAPQAQEPVETSSKIVERIGGPQTQSSAQIQASGPSSQRAALLIEAPEEPEKFKTYLGNVAWRLESVGRGQGQDLSQTIRIEADINQANLKLLVLIQKNLDPALPASHTLSMRFSPLQNSIVSDVAEIDLPVTRNETSSEIDPLVGVIAKITQNMFLIGLNNDPVMRTRNLEFLKARSWLDIPMRLSDGRMAKITFEKGIAGERVIADALAAWR